MIFKCKMCGGSLKIAEKSSTITCEYCATQQTLPKLDDDRKVNLYDRAGHFRRSNEYDKAMAIYETILNEDDSDAEAYWSLVLCKYGIEYVEDPLTHTRIPTCNRTQLISIFTDEDYKQAVKKADSYACGLYEKEAKTIDAIQKGILEISQKESPFDIFICYKETDNNGRRTQDSVLAQDLYHQLTQEGFKVFFARITLEDKIGTAYEPYIFAALTSSKIMVVIGTKTEYYNAVWVKNEWSRYLGLIKSGAKKTLIPAYRDIDPYDLPDEFSHLQAQDMGKLGFMQDLIRGIKKLTDADKPAQSPASGDKSAQAFSLPGVESLMKRGLLFLEDGEWDQANEYFEKVLDIDPENAQAYTGKLMAEIKIQKESGLSAYTKDLSGFGNYQKAVRFAVDPYKNILKEYNKNILEKLETDRIEKIYVNADQKMKSGKISVDFSEAAKIFRAAGNYKDAIQLAEKCEDIAGEKKLEETGREYDSLILEMDSTKNKDKLLEISKKFKSIGDYKDSMEMAEKCIKTIREIHEEDNKKAKKNISDWQKELDDTETELSKNKKQLDELENDYDKAKNSSMRGSKIDLVSILGSIVAVVIGDAIIAAVTGTILGIIGWDFDDVLKLWIVLGIIEAIVYVILIYSSISGSIKRKSAQSKLKELEPKLQALKPQIDTLISAKIKIEKNIAYARQEFDDTAKANDIYGIYN